jgi:hypothetical protein
MQLSIISSPYGVRIDVGVIISRLLCGTKWNWPTEDFRFSTIDVNPSDSFTKKLSAWMCSPSRLEVMYLTERLIPNDSLE